MDSHGTTISCPKMSITMMTMTKMKTRKMIATCDIKSAGNAEWIITKRSMTDVRHVLDFSVEQTEMKRGGKSSVHTAQKKQNWSIARSSTGEVMG